MCKGRIEQDLVNEGMCSECANNESECRERLEMANKKSVSNRNCMRLGE